MKVVKVKQIPIERRGARPRIHIFPKGENVLENLQRRHSRPYKAYLEHVIPALKASGHLPKFANVRWSQKAGCSCGCSPGFIVVSQTQMTDDLYVDVE